MPRHVMPPEYSKDYIRQGAKHGAGGGNVVGMGWDRFSTIVCCFKCDNSVFL